LGLLNAEHVYTLSLVGDGSALSFTIVGNYYGDNEGSLTVRIYELP